ncbi:hypothetical protein CC85DRAFT_312475 [Cutaneotrichosporon oleaginosum]|uniref:Mid2 domain-containing protein n=1 Tax=Cutaneotrichosporon oleaginosum TaxID=879819 RepID=A0A0J0XLN3_9TREE|nr:uncharacterized protein CC85DRAFT_312475 [Cutaneotrichosporon oleaginosum]KLT42011.1 hypothetical protein CC85DRAFT_312475 [Cutaneotrichosporon oleaginosum]TXT14332.1 hypothetical protein COLE_00525 [Cutaneotrichosporon oleaginosum]
MRLHLPLLFAALAAASPIPAPQQAPATTQNWNATASLRPTTSGVNSSQPPSSSEMSALIHSITTEPRNSIGTLTQIVTRTSASSTWLETKKHVFTIRYGTSRPTYTSSTGRPRSEVSPAVIFGIVGSAILFIIALAACFFRSHRKSREEAKLFRAQGRRISGVPLMASSTNASTATGAGAWPRGRDTVRDDDVDPELPVYSREVEAGATEIRVPSLPESAEGHSTPPAYVSPSTETGTAAGLPAYTSPTVAAGPGLAGTQGLPNAEQEGRTRTTELPAYSSPTAAAGPGIAGRRREGEAGQESST